MAGLRTDLNNILKDVIGSENVYFSPPNNLNMVHPCVIYHLSGQNNIFADDIKYRKLNRYTVIIVDEDPDSEIKDRLEELRHCSFSRFYVADYLNHWVYELYY